MINSSANSNSGKYDEIFNILQLHFRWKTNAPEHLLCATCGYILINACRVSCGCNFCLACLQKMLVNGAQYCPGSTELCKEELLSIYVTNSKANNLIKNLVLKCPVESCRFDCKLVDLTSHLISCNKKCVVCPFREIGCNDGEIIAQDMSDHLRGEGYNHSKILVDVINNIQGEMDRLRRNDERNRLNFDQLKGIADDHRIEVEILKQDLLIKDKLMEDINKEILLIKREKKDLEQQTDQLKQSLQNTINETRAEILKNDERNKLIGEELRLIKNDNLYLREQIHELKDNDTNIIQNHELLKEEFIGENIENHKYNYERKSQINEAVKWLDKQIDGSFLWKIDKISDKMQTRTQLFSGCFYSRIEAYKMNLQYFSAAGDDDLNIRFIIRIGERHPFHQWPLKANLTLKIVNKACPQTSKCISKYCVVSDPSKDKDKCTRSDDFVFRYSELSEAGLLQNDCLIIECLIDV